ncbi:MAG: DeoR/GlpR family DNA-binding transcription regulator [Rectinemataceae bacterium]
MFAEERKNLILEYVNERKKATVQELCENFSVSSATIRNDLRELEHNRLLLRTHGGAIKPDKAGFEPYAKEKEIQNSDLKRRIAAAAIGLIDNGDTIILDTGSTTAELAKLLFQKSDITVVTNDIVTALTLEDHPSAQVILVGGRVRKRFHCTVGTSGKDMLKSLTVDKAFMGANSFSVEKGASTPDLQQAEMKRLMITISTKIVFLVDSTKIGRNSFVQFGPIDCMECLVTDAIGENDRHTLEENGIEVIIAG